MFLFPLGIWLQTFIHHVESCVTHVAIVGTTFLYCSKIKNQKFHCSWMTAQVLMPNSISHEKADIIAEMTLGYRMKGFFIYIEKDI